MTIGTHQNTARHAGYRKNPGTQSRFYRYLPIAILLVSNFIPLLGVLYWGWDTFVLLMLYWLETLIIAFWTLLRILIAGDFSSSFGGEVASRIFVFAFFLVHAGGFMFGHFIFLWAFFGKSWLQEIPVTNSLSGIPLEAFWEKMVVANGLLIPLAVCFIGRGIAFLIEMSKLSLWKRLVAQEVGGDGKAGGLVGGLYGRIITMHVVIIIGAIFAQKFGALAPLVLLIVVKTAVDVWFFCEDRPERAQCGQCSMRPMKMTGAGKLRSFSAAARGESSLRNSVRSTQAPEQPDDQDDRQRNADKPQQKTASHLSTLPICIKFTQITRCAAEGSAVLFGLSPFAAGREGLATAGKPC